MLMKKSGEDSGKIMPIIIIFMFIVAGAFLISSLINSGISGKAIWSRASLSPDCSKILNKAVYTGTNDAVGLNNGDLRYLCYNKQFYICGYPSPSAAFSATAKNNQLVGSWKCDLTAKKWVLINPNCSKILNGKTYTGAHNKVGLNNGDMKYLCYDKNYYVCGISSPNAAFASTAKNNQLIGYWRCNATAKKWILNSPSVTNITCTDSDGGLNYNVRGTFSGLWAGNYITNMDACVSSLDENSAEVPSSNYLGEGYCENNQLKIKRLLCPQGCSNGTCLTAPNFTTTCTDSDGGLNYNLAGKTRWNNGLNSSRDSCWDQVEGKIVWDSPTDLAYVVENYCENNIPKTTKYKCPESQVCSFNVCMNKVSPPNASYIDTDGGKNYYDKGTVYYYMPVEFSTDVCMNRTSLWENFCETPDVLTCDSIIYNCPKGCYDGACIL